MGGGITLADDQRNDARRYRRTGRPGGLGDGGAPEGSETREGPEGSGRGEGRGGLSWEVSGTFEEELFKVEVCSSALVQRGRGHQGAPQGGEGSGFLHRTRR